MVVRSVVPELELVASGGIRNGLHVAKAIALGANVVGIGQPLLNPALESPKHVIDHLLQIIREIKIAMLCVGAANITALREAPLMRRSPYGWQKLK